MRLATAAIALRNRAVRIGVTARAFSQQICCVLIDHTNGRMLDVLECREKSVVLAWLAPTKRDFLRTCVK
jgi:hypothetical protein